MEDQLGLQSHRLGHPVVCPLLLMPQPELGTGVSSGSPEQLAVRVSVTFSNNLLKLSMGFFPRIASKGVPLCRDEAITFPHAGFKLFETGQQMQTL